MSPSVEIPKTSIEALAFQIRLLVCAGFLGLIIVLYGAFYSDYQTEPHLQGWILWALFLSYFYYRLCRIYKYLRFLKRVIGNSINAEHIAHYQTLLDKSFADACSDMESRARLTFQDKVVMASPLTWKRKQGLVTFSEPPFDIVISENNGRVGRLQVYYKGEGG